MATGPTMAESEDKLHSRIAELESQVKRLTLNADDPMGVYEPADPPPEGLSEDVERIYYLAHDMKQLHQRVVDQLQWMGRRLKDKSTRPSPPEMVDFGFLCREMEKYLDDLRKDAKKYKEQAGMLIARDVLTTTDSVNSVDPDMDKVHGKLASGVAEMVMIAEAPKVGTAEYIRFASFYGIPKASVEADHFPFSIHWKHAQEHVQECFEQGIPAPEGLGKKFPSFRCVFYRKKRKK